MTKLSKEATQARKIARKEFGYEKLRPGQEDAIKSALEGQDTLAVMPTGIGKSAIYQISALILPGPTIVVSPLIALQRDQLEAIQEQEIGGAALLNSTLKVSERRQVFEDLEANKLEFIFLAPEQLANPDVVEKLQAANPSLFVVDEAHCISEWGHDFRPDYLRLGTVIEELGHPTILALTATASPMVRAEIVERLGMRDAHITVHGFDRPNIHLDVEMFPDEAIKRRTILDRVVEAEKPGIIYVATRQKAEDISAALVERGVRAQHYHAGVNAAGRDATQAAFMADEIEVIVATTAFGMGVDKPNVRFVFHYDISDSVDSYYQEIGRAGRDGEQAQATLFYTPGDLGIRRFLAGGGNIDADTVEQVARVVWKHKQAVDPRDLLEELGISQTKLTTAISRLEDIGAINLLPSGEVEAIKTGRRLANIAEEVAESQERHQSHKQSRLEMIRTYAETRDCRRKYILNYFGEAFEAPCGNCDNCNSGRVSARNSDIEVPFSHGGRVAHASWGEGMVMGVEENKITVLFDDVGYKTLALDLVVEQGLLREVGK